MNCLNSPSRRHDHSRREMLTHSLLAVAGLVGCTNTSSFAADTNLEPFDRLLTEFIAENQVPGASLAITRNRMLVYARGYGFADVEAKENVRPESLFRIASVSKPITAVGILQLVEKQKLKLNDHVYDVMGLKPLIENDPAFDTRWNQITVLQCLQHTGGWDRDKSYDPIARPWQIAKDLGIQPPVKPLHIVRYMLGQPLDFNPGERYAYSNLGYLILGRIIEKLSNQSYEQYIQKNVLQPIGIQSMKLGRALFENRMKNEVRYYDAKKRMSKSLYPPHIEQQVPIQYGGQNFEAYEAHGGWIATASDLVQFAATFDEPAKCPILKEKTIREMWNRPADAAGTQSNGKPKASYYGCGWQVRSTGSKGGINTWHTGLIAGSESLLVRRWDGLNWAVLFNTQITSKGKTLTALIDGRLHEAADQVKDWPA